MFATPRGDGFQLQLSQFERNSRESYNEIQENGNERTHKNRILSLLKHNSGVWTSTLTLKGISTEAGARIHTLRREGHCIKGNIRKEGVKGKGYILYDFPHSFDLKGECSVCGTMKDKVQV